MQIGRYLKATRNKGLVLNPSGQLKVDAYPNNDFAELHGHEKVTDTACAKKAFWLSANCFQLPDGVGL
ncbi:hypothetical protein ACHAW6_001464 [Cyclotella cf. meneghiniana]